jgi:hypothetical protein
MSQINATVAAVAKPLQTTRKAPLAERTSRISALWAAFDAANGLITSKHLPKLADETGLNPTTTRIQFYAWRATRQQQSA